MVHRPGKFAGTRKAGRPPRSPPEPEREGGEEKRKCRLLKLTLKNS